MLMIYNKKRKNENKNKSVNIKSLRKYSEDEDKPKKNKIRNNIYKHHIPNKSMDINPMKKIRNPNKKENNAYNNIKQTQIKSGKRLGKLNENKKIINNYYFSNSNYNFNNFFQNNLSPKCSNRIYKKKYLTLKDNNIDFINSYTKENNVIDNSSENNVSNYKTNIDNYDSSPNCSSLASNRYSSKNKINLKVNKKSYYINNNYQRENISFKTNKNLQFHEGKITPRVNNNITYNKPNSPKRNYYSKGTYVSNNMNIKNNIEIYNQKNKLIKKKKWNLFKIEDMLIVEEKLLTLIEQIKFNKEVYKQCFDIMNFFYNSSLYKKLENIFKENNYINIAKFNIKFELISLIIIYEYSFNKNI